MKISRSRQFRVNMGNYEHYEFGCHVSIDHSDLGYTDDQARQTPIDTLIEEIAEKCLDVLNAQLMDEIRDAASLTDADKSFLLDSFTSDSGTGKRTRKARR